MKVNIGGNTIGSGYPVYMVAEMSANHCGRFETAVDIIHAAKESGADAVKLQTYTPDTITLNISNDYFRVKGTIWEGQLLHSLYERAYTPWEWQPELKRIADEIGIDIFSSPFDLTAVDFLEDIGMPAYKIASFELVDIPLIRKVAQLGKPVILSTGMASLCEIEEAVNTIRHAGNQQVILLKCNSAYPAPPEEMNLRTIPHLGQTFDIPIGLSDHTIGPETAVAAVALGACMIEKHFTLSRNKESPDAAFSIEPEEFRELVAAVRKTEKSLGRVLYETTAKEKDSKRYRRSLFVAMDMTRGERFTDHNVRSVRPADGLHPRYLDDIKGRTAAYDITAGSPLTWEMVGPSS